MTNNEVCAIFAADPLRTTRSGNGTLYAQGGRLFSYRYSWSFVMICGGKVYVNIDRYSVIMSKHLSRARYELSMADYTMIEMGRDELLKLMGERV